MSNTSNFDLTQRQQALATWLADCKRKMGLKFPKIDFDSDNWPIQTFHKAEQEDWHFTVPFADFESRDKSFCDSIRGLAAEMAVKGKPKSIRQSIEGFRLLKNSGANSFFEISLNDLRKIEDGCLGQARLSQTSPDKLSYRLNQLQKHIELLSNKGVIPQIGFRVRSKVKGELWKLGQSRRGVSKAERAATLDYKIEAFNDALNALFENDPRLSTADRVAIAAITRLMCAPSRINEILCSSIDDHATVEDYARRSGDKEAHQLNSAHQMLIITMKGSKGAQWSAKPALNFMIDAFHYTTEVIKQHGQRSRMLVEWYQQNPNTLYLPQELEYLRGKNLSRGDLTKIINLTDKPIAHEGEGPSLSYFNKLKHLERKSLNHNGNITRNSAGFLPFKDAEQLLLQNVRQSMGACRKVTRLNHYIGDLSKMLFLSDRETTPYLPWAIRDRTLLVSLNGVKKYNGGGQRPSLFKKLGISMPVGGKIEIAKIGTHDPRRWLTTMALRHGEKLSDVLMNKWANRLSLAQLKAYDMRPAEELAASSRMPEPTELADLSSGIERVHKLEEKFGLQSEIVTVHDAGISVTSMNQVLQAVEDRPVARTSEQIIILYPSQFGVCLHQQHEMPCRNYDSCLPCDNNIVVKGHLPTNDKVRKRYELLHKSVIRQLDRLAREHNMDIADDPHSLAHHMVTLIEKGLNRDQMADHLIEEFHEIKDRIKDKLLAKRLEEAFVAWGFVKRLDDDEVTSGALIKYHNPSYHASPGHEKALDSHGGREQIERDEQELIQKYPQFAPKALGLKDKRHLIEVDDNEGED